MHDELNITLEGVQPLLQAFRDFCGGDDAWAAAEMHYGEGRSLATIADWLSEPGAIVTRSAVHRRIVRVWRIATKYGLRPLHWKRQPEGRPKGKTFTTESELYEIVSQK